MDLLVRKLPALSAAKLRVAAAAFLILATAVALSWGYREYQKRALQASVVALVSGTTAGLRQVLEVDGDSIAAAPAGAARSREEQAAAIDGYLEHLRRLDPAPNRPLVDAAELYIVTGRELARRMASSEQHRVAFQQSTAALRALVESADRRSASWIAETLRARDRAAQDYFNYRLALDAAASLLGSLADATRDLKPRLDASLLVDENLRASAEQRTRAAATRAAGEFEQAKRLAMRQ